MVRLVQLQCCCCMLCVPTSWLFVCFPRWLRTGPPWPGLRGSTITFSTYVSRSLAGVLTHTHTSIPPCSRNIPFSRLSMHSVAVLAGGGRSSRAVKSSPSLSLARPRNNSSSSSSSNTLQQHTVSHHVDPDDYDMNFWHYQPWWVTCPSASC